MDLLDLLGELDRLGLFDFWRDLGSIFPDLIKGDLDLDFLDILVGEFLGLLADSFSLFDVGLVLD